MDHRSTVSPQPPPSKQRSRGSPVDRASRRPSPLPSSDVARAEKLLSKPILQTHSFQQYKVGVLAQLCRNNSLDLAPEQKETKANFIALLRNEHSRRSAENTPATSPPPSALAGATSQTSIASIAVEDFVTCVPLEFDDSDLEDEDATLGHHHFLPLVQEPPQYENEDTFEHDADMLDSEPEYLLPIIEEPPQQENADSLEDANWAPMGQYAQMLEPHILVPIVEEPPQQEDEDIFELETYRASTRSKQTDQPRVITVKLFEARNDWNCLRKIEYQSANGDVLLSDLHTQLECPEGLEIQVLDPERHRPFFAYQPGRILRADVESLLEDNYLRAVCKKKSIKRTLYTRR